MKKPNFNVTIGTGAIVIGLVAAGFGIIVALLSLLLPKKWREKLGIHVNFSHTHTS